MCLEGGLVVALLDKILRAGEGRALKQLARIADAVNSHEVTFSSMSDSDLRGMTVKFRERLAGGEDLDDLLPEAFAVVREASKRTLGQRHYDVQIMGGAALHLGNIAEMRTGEGKTLVATLPSYLNALTGRGVHIVTTNDYLAERDSEWMGRIHRFLGLKVGVILASMSPSERRENYAADITYGTNNEFGFDYLRDNMAWNLEDCVQREHNFAIVDEVDSILIDEARTPLIISGPADKATKWYVEFASIASRLTVGQHYEVDEKKRTVGILDEGVARVEEMLKIDNLYESVNTPMIGYLNNALKAKELFKRDRDYVVMNGELLIVDEHTGRVLSGRRYSEGLHQALEAKERVEIRDENQTLATITLQNYFRMYEKLAGMTGTAMTEAEEFSKIYKLDVTAIPTHRPMIRVDEPDLVYRTERAKDAAIIQHIKERIAAGQPVLVGTTSVERSEHLSGLLTREGVKHNVLNAKQHEREAPIVAQAGRSGTVTIATNMAGRGTDIVLGGNPAGLASEALRIKGLNPAEADAETYAAALAEAETACAADREVVLAAGGLRIIGTERHESRRIDNQLRGRAGRQGDPGSSRFYLSLEDDLMRRFAGERVVGLMDRLGFDESQALESAMVSRTIEGAQTRVEGYNFDVRKRVVEYDDVINMQRATVYGERDRVLRGEDLALTIQDALHAEARALAATHCPPGLPGDWNVESLATELRRLGLEPPASLDTIVEDSALYDAVTAAADAALERKSQEIGAEMWPKVERAVILRSIDQLWVEHLTEVDDLRRGIGLRGHAQIDPLNAFKIEAFKLYEEFQ